MFGIVRPQNDEDNAGFDLLCDVPETQKMQSDHRTRRFVSGYGSADLTATRKLDEFHSNEHVVPLEALQVGQDASGRDQGFVIDLPNRSLNAKYRGVGQACSQKPITAYRVTKIK